MNRPNVFLLGDDVVALLAGFYEVDQSKSFTKFDAAKFALLLFVQLDLDGHGANNVMVRKRTLDPKVFVSKRHCGYHATVLCEACMYSAGDEQVTGDASATCSGHG